jgi:tetratricopeptide (TPR) repeat protein
MAKRIGTPLKALALGLGGLVIGFAIYEKPSSTRNPADQHYHAAETLFEDQDYAKAASTYRLALEKNPDHHHARRGLARTFHQLGQHDEALKLYDQAIGEAPESAGIYANRGILLDTMGQHDEALRDYQTALDLDPDLGNGPGWLTRFLRNQAETPATIAARADYLQAELAKPETEQVLRLKDRDDRERPYQK